MAANKKDSKGGNVLELKTNEDKRIFALASALLGRAELIARMGKTYGTSRDVYTALGYNKTPVFGDYHARYERQDIAKRIVEAAPDATWRGRPTVVESEDEETKFERAWEALVDNLDAYHFISRADRISGIGEYGILLLGFDDAAKMEQPVESAKNLLYLHPYTQQTATIDRWIKDIKDRRYGLPEMYNVNLSNADKTGHSSIRAHWTRVIHVAEGLYENNVYGTPRLRPVLNRLQDLELISGGSAEMFWRGAFPGYGFKNDEGADISPQTLSDLQDEIEEYVHGLKRYIRLQNMSVEDLTVQVADPSKHFEILVSLISSATGIPKRILLGSERGELSSTQDRENWADRIQERRENYAGPRIIRELIDRLTSVGVLPEPVNGYEVRWPDAHVVSEADAAKVAETKAKALAAYASAMGADSIVPPDIFLTRFLGFTKQEVAEINDMIAQMKADEAAEADGVRRTGPPTSQNPDLDLPTEEDEV